MKSMKVKFVILLLLVGVLAACASPDTNAPSSQPTAGPAATEAPATTAPAADTAAPTVDNSSSSGAAAAAATVSFANDIQPVLDSRCVNCHGGERTSKGLSLKTYDTLTAGSENGPVVTPGDAANSPLAELVANGKMPKRGPKLTPDQVQLIVDWINQGAQNN
jgi:uncharacterized membrane protein